MPVAGGPVGLGLTTTVFIGASDGATGGPGFVGGIQTAFAVDAAIAVGGFLIAALLIGGAVHLLPHLHRTALAATHRAAAGRSFSLGAGSVG